MAKQVNTEEIRGRVSLAFKQRVTEYVDRSDNLSISDLVRRGAIEYMQNHPLRDPNSSRNIKVRVPGE